MLLLNFFNSVMKNIYIIAAFLLSLGIAHAQIIEVTQSTDCISNYSEKYTSPINAVTGANASDTIVICPGTYSLSGDMVINKPLNVQGYMQGAVVLKLESSSNKIYISANNVTIKNLTIITAAGGQKAFSILGDNILLEDVDVADSSFKYGFYIQSSHNVTIRHAWVIEADVAAFEVHDSSHISMEDSWILQEKGFTPAKSIALYNVSSSSFKNNRIFIIGNYNQYISGYAIYIASSSTYNNFSRNIIRRVDTCFQFADAASSNNLFYDNHFDCSWVNDTLGGVNYYNISKTPGDNIIGGSYIAGNYWEMGGGICSYSKPQGILPYTGSDNNNDGIGDTPYQLKSTEDCSTVNQTLISTPDYGPLIKQRNTSPPVVFDVNLTPNYELGTCTTLQASIASYDEPVAACTLHIAGKALPMTLNKGSFKSYCTYQLCPADFPQGYVAYYIEVKDEANNTATSEVRGLHINATPAVLQVISPANGSYYNTTNVSLEVTSSRPIVSWNYSVNGGGNVTLSTPTINLTLSSADGINESLNTIDIYALDDAGFLVHARVYFTVDLVPPKLNVLSPVNGTLYTTGNILVNATSDEAVTWRLELDGASFENVSMPHTLNVSDGVHSLVVYATDRAGNVNTSQVTFTVDTTPPYAEPASMNTKADLDAPFSFIVTLYDNIAGGYYRVLENGSNITSWINWTNGSVVQIQVNTSQPTTPVTLNYTIEFNDSAGWSSIAEFIFTVVDPNPPNITVHSPANGSYYNTTLIPLNTSSDRVVHTWLYSLNGSANVTFGNYSGSAYTKVNISGGDGCYLLEVWANSTAGNLSYAKAYFCVDTQPPTTTDDSPVGWQNAPFVVNLTAADNLSGVNHTRYRVDNGSWIIGDAVNITEDGNHTIEYYSVDNAGNVEPVKKTYAALDTTPPSVSIISPENKTYTTKNITLNVTASEEVNWSYSLNDGANVSFLHNTTITAREGANHLVVYALDRAGNLGSAEVYFTVDTIPPGNVSNLTAIAKVKSILLSWQNPSDEDLAGIEIWVDGLLTVKLNATATSYEILNLTPATTYHISLRTYDLAGNRGEWSNITVATKAEKAPAPPSGGGGGGGTNKNMVEKIIKKAEKASYAKVAIERWGIEEIAVKPRTDLYYARVKVEYLEKLPEYIEEPTDKIYLIFKVEISTKAIEKVKIKFKVRKDWLKENDINPKKVKLLRYHALKWEEFPAKMVGEDDEHYIYEAEVDSLSYFVVTGERGYVEEAGAGGEEEKVIEGFDFSMFSIYEKKAEEEINGSGVENKSKQVGKAEKKVEEQTLPEDEKEDKRLCGPAVILLISMLAVALGARRAR